MFQKCSKHFTGDSIGCKRDGKLKDNVFVTDTEEVNIFVFTNWDAVMFENSEVQEHCVYSLLIPQLFFPFQEVNTVLFSIVMCLVKKRVLVFPSGLLLSFYQVRLPFYLHC